MSHSFVPIWFAIACFAACDAPDGAHPFPISGEGVCAKCDSHHGPFGDGLSPAEQSVRRLHQDALRNDGVIDVNEVSEMKAFARRAEGVNEAVVSYILALADDPSALTEDAADMLTHPEPSARHDVPLVNEVYDVQPGSQMFLIDDVLTLKANGRVEGHTGLISHSRGYAAKREGVLFKRHGSLAPRFDSTHEATDIAQLRALGPDAALDRAARIFGLRLDPWNTFSHVARDPNYYDPSSDTPLWAGICQGWTHNALDNRLSLLVDVGGEEGERGLWIFGQWISRADLGNAMMGVSYSLGIADSVTIDSFVSADTLVKGLAQHVLNSGRGLRVDIWNDVHNPSGTYNPQVWNQPIVGGSIELFDVPADTSDAVAAYARANASAWSPLPLDVVVRRVQATAQWGTEAHDDWEGSALFKTSEWNMYMVTHPDGRVIRGFMANALHAAGVAPLPVTTSDGLPDYMSVPRHELTDAAFEDGEHYLLANHNPEGVRFRFLVGTVLGRGIPNRTRVDFEAAAFADGMNPAELAKRFPGIANAYTPEQWRDVFEPWLGPGTYFGAVWGEGAGR